MSYILDTSTPASKVINIDSRFAHVFNRRDEDGNQLTSDFLFQMKESVLCPEHLSMICFLQSATIPYSFYNIRHKVNNELILDFVDAVAGRGGTYKLVIPAGSYNAITFANYFTDTLNATDNEIASPWAPGLFRLYKKESGVFQAMTTNPFINYVVNMSLDLVRLRFKIYTTTQDSTLSCKWNDVETTVNDLFGFRDNAPQLIPYSTNGLTNLASDKVIDMNDEIHGLYLRTSLTSNGTLNAQTGVFSDILARIPITCNPGGIIFHTPNNSTHKLQITSPVIKYILVRLTDDHNRLLDLNGMHFQISVQIDFVPRIPNLVGLTKTQRRLKIANKPNIKK
jgi:hypothetical protein